MDHILKIEYVENWQTYYYCITAVDIAGNESEFSEVISALPTPDPEEITANKSSIFLEAGETEYLVIIANYWDSTTMDVTNEAIYSSSDDTVAKVSTSGLIEAIRPGDVTITVTYKNCSSSINITVESGFLIGDLNNDGYVNMEDLEIISGCYGLIVDADSPYKDYDFNQDRIIDIYDFVNISKKI